MSLALHTLPPSVDLIINQVALTLLAHTSARAIPPHLLDFWRGHVSWFDQWDVANMVAYLYYEEALSHCVFFLAVLHPCLPP